MNIKFDVSRIFTLDFLFLTQFDKNMEFYAYIPCMSSDSIRTNTLDSDLDSTSRLSPKDPVGVHVSTGDSRSILSDKKHAFSVYSTYQPLKCLYLSLNFCKYHEVDDDNEEIHFNKQIHQHRTYCMRHREEAGHSTDTTSSSAQGGKRRPSLIQTLRCLWGKKEGVQGGLGGERVVSDQHRFIEVTDPSLHHIVSQQHAKAITGEDDLVAETLKREAHRVARAHTRSTSSRHPGRDSSQVFYEEGDIVTHRSPVKPIFYESRARSAKLATTAVGKSKSKSSNSSNSNNSSNSSSRRCCDDNSSNSDREVVSALSALEDDISKSGIMDHRESCSTDRWHKGNTQLKSSVV